MTFYEWCIMSQKKNLLEEWDEEKNDLTPKAVLKTSGERVWWKCSSCGHSWETCVKYRYRGSGCPECGKRKVSCARKLPPKGKSIAEMRPALVAEWHPTKNGEIRPQDVSFKSHQKVWWHGTCGHEWEAAVSSRSSGCGCPICANQVILSGYNDLYSQYPEVAAEWNNEKNDRTAKEIAAQSNRKVWWRCSICGNEWEAAVSKRVIGQGCPRCAKERRTSFQEKAFAYYLQAADVAIVENFKDTWLGNYELDILIPEFCVAIEYDGPWHTPRRDLLKYEMCKAKGIELIRVRDPKCSCKEDMAHYSIVLPDRKEASLNEAIKAVLNILKGTYGIPIPSDLCVDVAADRISIYELMELQRKANSVASTHPELLSEWNYRKNGDIRPEDIMQYSDKKVWWKCDRYGHEWQAAVKSRSKGSGCPVCAGNLVLDGFNDLETIAPKLAQEWHPTKNSPMTAKDITAHSSLKVWWQCPICKYEWEAAVYSRSGGKRSGCPECAKKHLQSTFQRPKNGNSLAEMSPDLTKEWHPTKNGTLRPEDVTFKSHRKVWWKCSKGKHEWEAVVASRSVGNGCPICYREARKKKDRP